MTNLLRRPAFRALLSGLAVYPLVAGLDMAIGDKGLGKALPGLLFGLLVLAPLTASAGRRALAVAASVLIYYGASSLAAHAVVEWRWREMVACAFSGFLGAVAVGLASRFILAVDVTPRRLTRAALVGAAAGSIFGINGTFSLPSLAEPALLLLGFTLWQTGVAWALFERRSA